MLDTEVYIEKHSEGQCTSTAHRVEIHTPLGVTHRNKCIVIAFPNECNKQFECYSLGLNESDRNMLHELISKIK